MAIPPSNWIDICRDIFTRSHVVILCPFCFFDKIDSPFCLQNCFFRLAAHFAQILLSKFWQAPEIDFRYETKARKVMVDFKFAALSR